MPCVHYAYTYVCIKKCCCHFSGRRTKTDNNIFLCTCVRARISAASILVIHPWTYNSLVRTCHCHRIPPPAGITITLHETAMFRRPSAVTTHQPKGRDPMPFDITMDPTMPPIDRARQLRQLNAPWATIAASLTHRCTPQERVSILKRVSAEFA